MELRERVLAAIDAELIARQTLDLVAIPSVTMDEAAVCRAFERQLRELELPVIALAQVNRSSEDRQDHRPRLADLRESGSIEQDADTVIMLHRPGRYEDMAQDNKLDVIVAKQRNGPTGDVTLFFRKEYMLYENYDPLMDH